MSFDLRKFAWSSVVFLAIVLFVSSSVVTGAEETYEPPDFDPESGYTALSVPRADEPPEIDGVIESEEWADATMINVMGDQKQRPNWSHLYPRWVKWYLKWDRDNLYLASSSQRLSGENPKINYRDVSLGGNTVGDDSIEIHFSPFGRNAVQGAPPWGGQAILNPLGVGYYSQYAWEVAARTTSWLPDWEIGSKVHEESWDIEIAIPRETLDVMEPNEIGDAWSVLLARNWKRTGWNQSSIPTSADNFHTPRSQPPMFLYDGAYVQLQDVQGLFEGDIHTEVMVGNNSDGQETVTLELLIEEDSGAEDRFTFAETEEITLDPGETIDWTVDESDQLQEGVTYRYYLEAHAEGWDRPLARVNFFVEPGSHEWLQKKAQNMSSPDYRFSVKLAPTKYELQASADFFYSSEADKIARLHITVQDEEGVVFEGESDNVHKKAIKDVFQLPELSPGEYEWEMVLVSEDGAEIEKRDGTFEKKNEAEEFPWWDFSGADVDRVLWPYEAIKVGADHVDYWGGRLYLNGLNLPRQLIVTANQKWRPDALEMRPAVLSRGVEIRAEQDDEPVQVKFQGHPNTGNVEDWEAELYGYGQIGETVEIRSDASFKQEGLLWVDLTLRPGLDASSGRDERRKTATLDGLTVDIPIREEVAELLVARVEPGNYGEVYLGAMPEGEDVVFGSGEIGRGVLTKGDLLPFIWLGNDQRGLMMLVENNEGWVHAGESDQQIIRRDGECILRLNIIQDEVTLDGERTISFGLLPTPMRKMTSGWRMVNCSLSQNFVNWYGYGIVDSRAADGASVMPSSYQKNREKMFKLSQQITTRLGGKEFAPHTERGSYQTRTRDRAARKYFGPEWQYNTWTESFQNHLLWNMQKYIEEGGLTGIYHDQYFPNAMTNTITGAAWTLEDGRVNRGYNMLKDRRFTMREYALFMENNIKPRIFVHATNTGQMIGYPWVTAVLDGEDKPVKSNADYDTIDMYSPERMQAHGNPWPWGTTFYWMDMIRSGDEEWEEKQERTLLGWRAVHDVMDPVGKFREFRQKVAEWGMNDDQVKFWPYWRNDEFVHVDQDDVVVSMWTLPDRALLCAVNLDRNQSVNTSIRIPLYELGLNPEVRAEYITARDIMDDGKVGFDAWNGEVSVKVGPRDFRLISIRKYAN